MYCHVFNKVGVISFCTVCVSYILPKILDMKEPIKTIRPLKIKTVFKFNKPQNQGDNESDPITVTIITVTKIIMGG